MTANSAQVLTNKQEFRWGYRRKGKEVFNLCQQLTFVVTLGGALLVSAGAANANPVGGNVTAGSATISASGTTTTINQTSGRAIIEWSNFDIAAGETTKFIQPSSSSIALNRVVNSQQATSINGNLTANGRVLVINPNGVLIGGTGRVDVGGFVASTADVDNNHFMTATGAMSFDRAGNANAVVENRGRITVQDTGLSLMVAPTVRNSGVIEGNMAKLQMGAGDTFGVDLYGDGLLYLAVGKSGGARTLKAENTGAIIANAGRVLMTAASADNLVNSVINTSGVVEAKGLVAKGGEIILTGAGADIEVAGTVDASGKTGGGTVKIGGADGQDAAKTVTVSDNAQLSADAGLLGDGGAITLWSDVLTTSRGRYSAKGGSTGGNGGFVETSSKTTLDIADSFVDTSAAAGSYGLWLLDPTDYTITKANVGAINSALSNVSLSATGDFYINADVNIAKAGIDLTIKSNGNITMNNQTITLNGGDLTMDAGGTVLTNNGSITTKGGNVDINGAGNLQMSSDIATNGGTVYLHSKGNVQFNNSDIVSAGGNVELNGKGSTSIGNSSISTGGGDLKIASKGSVSSNNLDINTTGGSTTATVTIVDGGSTKSFSKVYTGGSSHLYTSGNAGDVTISGSSVSGNQMCISAGGTQCGVVSTPTPSTVSITVKADDIYKTYGNLDPALTYSVTAGALLSGDSFTGALARAIGNIVGTYAINQGTLTAVTSGSYTYVITYIPGVFTINPAFLTITAQDQGKTYGDALALGTTAFSTSGLVAGDSVTGVTLTSSGAAATANVNTYDIFASGATGAGLSNYTISYVKGSLVVDPAALTITANNRTKVYGNSLSLGTTAFSTSGLKNSDTVTGVTLTSSGTAATANVNTYGIAASAATGTGLGNYTITYVNGNLVVSPAALTITANNRLKTYGDAVTLGTTAFGVSGLKNSDNVTGVTLTSAGAAATANAGSHAITASAATGTGLSNYTISYVDGTFNVLKAALVVTADWRSKTYGDALNLGTTAFDVSGLKNSDTVSGVTLTSSGAAATAGVGLYGVGVSGATGTGLGNYNITYIGGGLVITPATLTVTANDRTKTYGDTLALGTTAFTTSGLKNSDSVTGVTLFSLGTLAAANVNTYGIGAFGATGTGLGNYIINYVGGNLVVNPAALTITANNRTKTYGDTLALGTTAFGTSGLKNNDHVTGVTLASAGTVATANVNTYGITASAATGTGLGNYTITYVNGNLVVSPAALTITANDRSKTYGSNLSLGTTAFGTSGLKNSDHVTGVTLTSAGAAATANVNTYGIVASAATGTGLSNYTITYVNGNLVVNPAALKITANGRIKIYGDDVTLGTTAFSTQGLKNSDHVTGVTLTSAGAVATANAGSYGITASSATGTGLSNYVITYVDGTFAVLKAALVVTADWRAKTYGDALNLGTTAFGVAGLKNSDTVTGVTLTSSGAAATAGVGLYGIGASGATGTGLGNYNIVYIGGGLLVNPALLTVTANDRTKTYGDALALGTTAFGVSGLKNSDAVNGVTLTSAGAAATANAGSYGIGASSATGTGLGNYIIHYVGGNLVVDPAALTITANGATKTYGDDLDLGTAAFTASGLKNSDAVSGVTLASDGAAATANVDTYAITASAANGTGLSNYTITYVDGSLVVNPAALTITADNRTKTYGSVLSLGTTGFTASGLKNSDAVTGVTLASGGAAGTANVGDYGVTASAASGTGLSNYTISYVDGNLHVNPAPLTIIANNQTKTEGQTFVFNGTEFTVSGTLYNGDTVTSASLGSAGAAASATDVGSPYSILIGGANGAGVSNYDITYVAGTMTVNASPYKQSRSFSDLSRPVVSVANNVLTIDTPFRAIETRTLKTDVALLYRGNTSGGSNPGVVLASIEPAGGGNSPEDLAAIEPAAGGNDNGGKRQGFASSSSDIVCANDFLNNVPCGGAQAQ